MKLSFQVAIFLILLNFWANLLVAGGVADAMGFQPDPQLDDDAVVGEDDVNESVGGLSAGGISELFSLFITGGREVLGAIFGVITRGPQLLIAAGIPGEIVAFFFGPMYAIVLFDIVSYILGRVW